MKILVSAYLDKNLGDDLMILMLAEKLKNHEIYLNCDNDVNFMAFEKVNNIKRCNIKGNILSQIRQIKAFDAYITVGGSIFIIQKITSIIYRLGRLPIFWALRGSKTKIIYTGCNLGPFNKIGKLIAKLELSNASLITVRDKKSYEFLLKMNKHDYIYNFHDIVLSYEDKNKITSGDDLGISVYRSIRDKAYNYSYYKKLADISDLYIEKTGKNVILFAFDSENENDISAAYNIRSFSKNKENIKIIVYSGDVKDTINEFGRCKFIISTRFHSAILAIRLGIPFVPIVYSEKTDNMLDDLKYDGIRMYFKDMEGIKSADIIDSILESDKIAINYNSSIFENSLGHLTVVNALLEDDEKVLDDMKSIF